MSDEPQSGNGSNGSNALAKLLNQLNLPTLALIMLTGGGNFLITKEDGRLTRNEAERVSREVHELYASINSFEVRQKENVSKAAQSLDNQGQQLRNQTQLLENQQRILTQLQRWQQNYKNPE